MTRRKQNPLPINDFAAEDELNVSSFTSEPIATGECISSFSFNDDSIKQTRPNATDNTENINNIGTSSNIINPTVNFDINFDNEKALNFTATSTKNNTLEDNRKAPVMNGMAPPINGEYLDVKRTYMLRSSTVRKVNELKSRHPELNTYVSTIVDLAITHYYEYIINGGRQ